MWDGLGDMVEGGLAGAVGVSNYGPRQLRRAHAHLAARGVPLATCQVQFSLLSDTRLQRETKEACDELGVALIAETAASPNRTSNSTFLPLITLSSTRTEGPPI